MTTATAAPDTRAQRFTAVPVLRYVPGVLLLIAIGLAGAGHLGVFTKADITSLGNVSKWAFLLTFAGVGLNTDFRAFARSGWRPFIVGALSLAVVAITSLLLVLGATAVFDLG
jgi:uncharacterized membrane protein YadS